MASQITLGFLVMNCCTIRKMSDVNINLLITPLQQSAAVIQLLHLSGHVTPIEPLFGMLTCMCPRNHLFDGVRFRTVRGYVEGHVGVIPGVPAMSLLLGHVLAHCNVYLVLWFGYTMSAAE